VKVVKVNNHHQMNKMFTKVRDKITQPGRGIVRTMTHVPSWDVGQKLGVRLTEP
jgi:hypothetical protein